MEKNRLDTLSPGHSPNQTPTWTWKSFSRGVSLESVGCHYSHSTIKRLLPLSSTGKVLQTGVWKLLRRSVKIKGNGLEPGERCERKRRIFPQKNGRIFGWRGLEPRNLKMLGFVQAGHVLWDFKTVSPSALMVSFQYERHFRDHRNLPCRFRPLFSSSGPQASSETRSLSSESFGVVRKRKLSAGSRGCRRQERKKDDVWLS